MKKQNSTKTSETTKSKNNIFGKPGHKITSLICECCYPQIFKKHNRAENFQKLEKLIAEQGWDRN